MEKAVYTHKQMCDMMVATRNWTLNNPSGVLPFMPVQWCDNVSQKQNEKAHKETMPPLKKPHRLIRVFMFLKLI